MIFSTLEHAFQALKTLDLKEREEIMMAETPSKAKKLGKKVTLRKDWEGVKLKIMEDLLRSKFSLPTLRKKLIETGNNELVEKNNWHDNFWGICICNKCKGANGKNHLGKLLMKIRNEL